MDFKSFQELKLQRDVIVMLAFIASSGKSGFDVLLYTAASRRENFLELIVRVLASQMDEEKSGLIDCKERLVVLDQFIFNKMNYPYKPEFNNCNSTAVIPGLLHCS